MNEINVSVELSSFSNLRFGYKCNIKRLISRSLLVIRIRVFIS
jgi:hypothetical protein